jgi:enoyl-CoA hydratase/carnithine racemase
MMGDDRTEQNRVVTVIQNGVANVRLNRPEKLNALDEPMFAALIETGERLASEAGVRAVVLSGEGRGFCAGLDLTRFQAMVDPSQPNRTHGPRSSGRIGTLSQYAAWIWAEMPVPVLAAVHGVALGGGLQLALAADVRIVSPEARLSVLEIRWGLIPDMTGTYVLPRLVGVDVAKELTWTGRMVGGDEAVQLGLATHVSDTPLDDALALAAEIATNAPDAIRAAKQLLNISLGNTPKEHFAEEEAAMNSLRGTVNQREAVSAYFEKRSPRYANPGETA